MPQIRTQFTKRACARLSSSQENHLSLIGPAASPLSHMASLRAMYPLVLLAAMTLVLVCMYRLHTEMHEVRACLQRVHDTMGGVCEHRYQSEPTRPTLPGGSGGSAGSGGVGGASASHVDPVPVEVVEPSAPVSLTS